MRQPKRRLIRNTIPVIALAIGGLAVADENWKIFEFYSPISPQSSELETLFSTVDDYVSYMLILGYSNKKITANLKEKGYYWPDDRGYWDVITPEPSSGKFVPDVPEWVGKDYRDLTPSPDSRERICWDDRPVPERCYGAGYTYGGCTKMDLPSKELAEPKRFYDNRCRNWDWDEYWIKYKADIDAGRR